MDTLHTGILCFLSLFFWMDRPNHFIKQREEIKKKTKNRIENPCDPDEMKTDLLNLRILLGSGKENNYVAFSNGEWRNIKRALMDLRGAYSISHRKYGETIAGHWISQRRVILSGTKAPIRACCVPRKAKLLWMSDSAQVLRRNGAKGLCKESSASYMKRQIVIYWWIPGQFAVIKNLFLFISTPFVWSCVYFVGQARQLK